jgi:hypothetical protein
VSLRPAGIETGALSTIAREQPIDAHRPRLRMGYFGGLLKHKGVHLLLEACEGLGDVLEVQVHGTSRDLAYRDHLAALARAMGARMLGAYEPRELPARMAGVDLVVVPSLWSENAPFVIREAFAAGRPVVAARTEALAESVRDGVDGLLFKQGDVAELRAVLQHLTRDRSLIATLRDHIAPVLDIDLDAQEWLALYRSLSSPPAAQEAALPHLADFARRHDELSTLPTAELTARVLAGLPRLARVLGVAPEAGAWVQGALEKGLGVRDELSESARRVAWLESCSSEERRAREAERARADWLSTRLEAMQAELDHERAKLAGQDEENRSLESERDWLRDVCAEREGELDWMRRDARARADQVAEAGRAHAELEQALESRREETEWLQGIRAAQEEELEWLRGLARRLDEVSAECGWRAEQMERARLEGRAWTQRLFGGSLGKRARSWTSRNGSKSTEEEA